MRNAVISCQNYNSSNPPITKLHGGIEWIGYKSNNVPNGFMSYFGTTLNVNMSGVYIIYMSADDKGWLYINGKEIGSTSISASWHQVSEFKVRLDKGLYGLTVSVKNYCLKCPSGSCVNPSSLAMFVKNPNGNIVLSTNTGWKTNSSIINYRTLGSIKEALIKRSNLVNKEIKSHSRIGSGNEVNMLSTGSNNTSIINTIIPYAKKYIPYIGIGIATLLFLKRRGSL